MSAGLSRLSLNQKLALVALLLGGVALFSRVAPDRVVEVHQTELATAIERQDDHVTPAELASWIVAGRTDYRLVDIRDAEAFAEYHIPTAENYPLATLPDAPLARNETIVVYSDGGIHASQAWMLLRGSGYAGARTLLGSLAAWQDEVLFPTPPQDPTPQELARFERTAAVARFFGGAPREGGGAAQAELAPPELPQVELPQLPAARAAPRKKREGC